MQTIFTSTDFVNNLISGLFPVMAALLAAFSLLRYGIKTFKERDVAQAALLTFLSALLHASGFAAAFGLAWYLPTLNAKITPALILWAEAYAAAILFFRSRATAENRGLITALLHLAILNIGWLIDRWLGMLFFSAPLLFVFNHAAEKVARAVMPISDSQDKKEAWETQRIFYSYLWGLQMPLWNVEALNAREAEKRIDGSPFPENAPAFHGFIKTHSHQVVGISNGVKFRVEGPGIIFTRKGDRPFEVVDLRTRTRDKKISAFSKEGIPFAAKVFVTFKIDREEWSPALFHEIIRDDKVFPPKARFLDRNLHGTFPYSSLRVKSALCFRSKRAQPDGEIERWDDLVLQIAEEAAREVLAECPLIELWNLEETNALNEIAKKMKESIALLLRKKGILLVSAKAMPEFSESDALSEKVIKQQIETWSIERQREQKNSADKICRRSGTH
ncbi:MAG: hypothetical protein Fur002_08240 [Anaerolineales bacterium]